MAISKTKSLAAYVHIRQVLDTLLNRNQWPAYYRLPSKGQATSWRQQANYFRTVYRQNEEHRLGLPEGTGTSPWDHLIIRAAKHDPAIVEIDERINIGELIIGDEVVELDPVTPTDEDVIYDLDE